tara:strand:+ start:68 stop:1390 length:1323 start_codon:yes stop_codon:yes gene_type:complete
MARLDKVSDSTALLKVSGQVVADLNRHLDNGTSINREESPFKVQLDRSSKGKTYNKNQIQQFQNLVVSRKVTASMRVELQTTQKKNNKPVLITIGSITRPEIKANMGDVAEGVFAAALAARFFDRTTPLISADSVYSVLNKLSVKSIPGKKSVIANYSDTPPNQDGSTDVLKLSIVLGEANMNFLKNTINKESLREFVNASLQYANRGSVMSWVKTIYENNKKDTIEILGDGVSNQKSTKVDVRVKITDSENNLLPVDINVSVKAGNVKQFGQVVGLDTTKIQQFFSDIFGVTADTPALSQFTNKVNNKNVSGAFKDYYKNIDNKLSTISQSTIQKMGEGIIKYATLNEEGVQLVQLNKGEADIFRFNNVTEELKKYNYYATLNINKSLPEISISSSSKILFTIRAKKETDSKTNKITYRNYIEKGPFLGQLIATSASQE